MDRTGILSSSTDRSCECTGDVIPNEPVPVPCASLMMHRIAVGVDDLRLYGVEHDRISALQTHYRYDWYDAAACTHYQVPMIVLAQFHDIVYLPTCVTTYGAGSIRPLLTNPAERGCTLALKAFRALFSVFLVI